MPTLFEGIALSNQNNLVRQQLEQNAVALSQNLFDLRDRFSSTFQFEQGLANGLDPISALGFAQQNSTLGGFNQLFNSQLGALTGLNGLQLQNQRIQANSGVLQTLINQLSPVNNTNTSTQSPTTNTQNGSQLGSTQQVSGVGPSNQTTALFGTQGIF